MISRFFQRLSTHGRSTAYQVGAMSLLGTVVMYTALDLRRRKARAQLHQNLTEVMSPTYIRPPFEGVSVQAEAESLLKRASQGLVFIFGPKGSGKTSLLNYLSTSAGRPIIKLSFAPYPSTRILPNYSIIDLTKVLDQLLHEVEEALILVDDIETLPNYSKLNFINYCLKWTRHSKISILLATHDASSVAIAKASNPLVQVHGKWHPTKEEYIEILKKHGISKEDAELAYEEYGPDLYFGLPGPVKEGIENKRKLIEEHVNQLLYKPEIRAALVSILMTVGEKEPLGSVYVESPLGQELYKRGLMVQDLDSALRFRNKFVLKVISQSLK